MVVWWHLSLLYHKSGCYTVTKYGPRCTPSQEKLLNLITYSLHTIVPQREVLTLHMLIFLTHLPLDKMAAIWQMIFSDAFSGMKMFVVWCKIHQSLSLRVQLTISQHCFRWYIYIALDNDLTLIRQQAIIWSNADPIHWHICVTRGRWVKKQKFISAFSIIPPHWNSKRS